MPHAFVNRPRLHRLTSRSTEPRAHFGWETANAVLYLAGGLVFMAGSVLFFPSLEAFSDAGAWTFFFGSILYVVVTAHDMAEAIRYGRTLGEMRLATRLELTAAASYLTGTVLFTVGSLFFLSWIHPTGVGAWCFLVGSLLFVIGACINVLQIVEASTLITLQLMNLTAIAFIVGSVLFVLASVPYLWRFEAADDRMMVDSFLAWQFVIGSALFFFGGLFNYWRATLVTRAAVALRERS